MRVKEIKAKDEEIIQSLASLMDEEERVIQEENLIEQKKKETVIVYLEQLESFKENYKSMKAEVNDKNDEIERLNTENEAQITEIVTKDEKIKKITEENFERESLLEKEIQRLKPFEEIYQEEEKEKAEKERIEKLGLDNPCPRCSDIEMKSYGGTYEKEPRFLIFKKTVYYPKMLQCPKCNYGEEEEREE